MTDAVSTTETTTAAPEAPTVDTTTPAATPATPEQAPAAPEWDGKVESLPAAEQAQRDAIKALAKAAGIDLPGDDDAQTPDPAALAADLTAERNKAREAAVQLAVYRAAAEVGANPNALLDSVTFVTSLADVDPTDAEAIKTAIQTAVTKDARFRVAQAAPRSGGDLPGGTGEGTVTKEQFAAMSPAEKNTLYQTNPTRYRQLTGR